MKIYTIEENKTNYNTCDLLRKTYFPIEGPIPTLLTTDDSFFGRLT